jgi:hypothetical protein
MTADATISREILSELRKLRDKVTKLEQLLIKKDDEKEQWVTGDVLMKLYNVTAKDLEQFRNQNVIRYRKLRKYAVRYSLQSAEHFFNNKKTIS